MTAVEPHAAEARTHALVPPHNLEAEQSVLGAILLADTTLYGLVIGEGLKPEHFYREQHATIYRAMLALYQESREIDVLTVTEQLRATGKLGEVGGAAMVDAVAGAAPAAGNVREYARIVQSNALLRRLLSTTQQIQANVYNHEAPARELVEWAERDILEVAHDDRQKDFRAVGEVLHDEIDKLHRLSIQQTALTGTPSGFKDLDEITGGFQAGNLVILAARPSMGKCLGGASLVYDPATGARRRIDEVVASVERGEPAWVASVGPDLKLDAARVSAALRNGRKPVYRLTTRLGRRIEATANHPLLTIGGWRELQELQPGTRIAVPRWLPRTAATTVMPDHDVVLLAALIADGNLTQRTPRFCYGPGSPVLVEVERAAAAYGLRLHCSTRSHGTATISGGRGSAWNPVRELCEAHGLWDKRSEEKFVPDAIFGLDDDQIARFLSILYGCDGHIHAGERFSQIGYTTISERLARDVQHLLLRFGIVATIRTLKRDVYEGTSTVAREVRITGQDGLATFCHRIGAFGKHAAADRVLAHAGAARRKTNVDTLPAEAWSRIIDAKGARPWRELALATGRPQNHNWHVGQRGLSRELMGELAVATESVDLAHLATSDLWWDEVASIEPIGEQETYDLTVPGNHNFVADDIVVHNSALVTNIAENAALEHGKPVALFSLEMSEAELAQRFVASQARIKGEELRKGRVAESRWPKILQACQRLTNAPLYVDDSSDVGILELRAKARRLHQQSDGGLGLIIVDYLQLMRPDGRVENRVEQVGQISRGLKILARELEVPVIALSQLSRAVEQRHDKKPILSDLRESGQIEQDADLVMFIFREEYYDKESEREGEADIIIAKHRNGALGDVVLTFQKEYPKFMNYAGERFAG
jgi:replicative DNA helicase